MRVTSVLFNSDIANDYLGVFYPNPQCFFEMLRFSAPEKDLRSLLCESHEYMMQTYGIMPKIVFIPFYLYGEYEKGVAATEGGFTKQPISMVCDELGVKYVVMTPDALRDKIAQVTKINKEV